MLVDNVEFSCDGMTKWYFVKLFIWAVEKRQLDLVVSMLPLVSSDEDECGDKFSAFRAHRKNEMRKGKRKED